MQYDIVIVGAGTAGMPCAISAAEAGAKVVVVERDSAIGGTLDLSAGQMSGAGSRLQRSKGIDDSAEQHFEDVVRLGHGKADPVIARLAVEEAHMTIDWLEELGFPFGDDQPVLYYGHDPYFQPRTYWGPEMGFSILHVVAPRFDALVAEGRIDLRLEHRMTELILEDGRVTGLRADGPDGPVELRGGATVLTTGGYAANHELFATLHPGLNALLGGRSTSQGDGLVAARAIGAGFRNADNHLSTVGGIESFPGSRRCELWEAFGSTNANMRTPREIYVNAAGERYVAEDGKSQDTQERALMQQGGTMWFVFDEASIDDDDPLVFGWSSEMLREFAAKGQNAWTSGEIRELARKAGIDHEGLTRTVESWNASCRSESDALGRTSFTPVSTPPFYAVLSEGTTVISFGGLTVDGELNVVDVSGRPIPCLYAAGEVIGAGATMGDAHCSGMCVTPALTLGRNLGGRLAASVSPSAAV